MAETESNVYDAKFPEFVIMIKNPPNKWAQFMHHYTMIGRIHFSKTRLSQDDDKRIKRLCKYLNAKEQCGERVLICTQKLTKKWDSLLSSNIRTVE